MSAASILHKVLNPPYRLSSFGEHVTSLSSFAQVISLAGWPKLVKFRFFFFLLCSVLPSSACPSQTALTVLPSVVTTACVYKCEPFCPQHCLLCLRDFAACFVH